MIGQLEGRPLSPREIQTLRLLAGGLSYDEAATAHMVSRRTIESQAYAARHKLGARSMLHAVYLAMRQGLI